jgi:hypothetical protein
MATVDEGMLERSGQGHVRASRPSAAEARVSNNGLHMQAVMCLRPLCNVELHKILSLRGHCTHRQRGGILAVDDSCQLRRQLRADVRHAGG